jgi:hypothetical protein
MRCEGLDRGAEGAGDGSPATSATAGKPEPVGLPAREAGFARSQCRQQRAICGVSERAEGWFCWVRAAGFGDEGDEPGGGRDANRPRSRPVATMWRTARDRWPLQPRDGAGSTPLRPDLTSELRGARRPGTRLPHAEPPARGVPLRQTSECVERTDLEGPPFLAPIVERRERREETELLLLKRVSGSDGYWTPSRAT